MAALSRRKLRQLRAHQCTRERLTTPSRIRHALAHLAACARTIARAATAALVEADTGVQKDRQGPPGRGVAPPRRREGGTHMDQRLGTARAEAVVVTKVVLLVGGPTGQTDKGGLRMGHAGHGTDRPGWTRPVFHDIQQDRWEKLQGPLLTASAETASATKPGAALLVAPPPRGGSRQRQGEVRRSPSPAGICLCRGLRERWDRHHAPTTAGSFRCAPSRPLRTAVCPQTRGRCFRCREKLRPP